MKAHRIINPKKVFIIAEAGVNHNGSLETALRMVDAAKTAGADAIKYQTFRPGECTGKFAIKVNYLKKRTKEDESRYQMSARLALPYPAFKTIQAYCSKKGILFLTTPDGYPSLEYVTRVLKLPILKVSSTEVTHLEFLEKVASRNKPVILSTGLSTLGEVETAITALRSATPSLPLYLLHCTSEYPAPDNEINLRAMQTLGHAFKLPVGLSDHSVGSEAAVAAVSMGAVIIEKHFTLDSNMEGPDHAASLDPAGLAQLVKSIRRIEQMLGSGIKTPSPTELKNMTGIRRSIVAAGNFGKGARLTRSMLTFKRPGNGIEPRLINHVLGFRVNKPFVGDQVLHWEDLK